MTPSEAQRFQLRERLIEVLREKPAMTLMESLPPVDWREFATKNDLAALEERLNARLDALRTELNAKIDTGLTDLRGETKFGLARQTYVILAGFAAAMTPIYIALFTGAGVGN